MLKSNYFNIYTKIMKLLNLVMILCVSGLFISCEKKEPVEIPSNKAQLLKVTYQSGDGIIDTLNKKVILKLDERTDIGVIIPKIEISPKATIFPPSDVAVDLSNPVLYTITSEDKSKKYIFTLMAYKAIAEFTVWDCSTWTPEITRVVQPAAIIKVFSKSEKVGTTETFDVLSTDPYGKAKFYGLRGTTYFITVSKDNKSSIKDGYVLNGRWDSQTEIENSGFIIPDASVGGYRFADINGDGRIWPDDKSNFDYFWVYSDMITLKLQDLYISN
jgi:hypothetical protein